jgi:UDP-3-O-[3-hydroxymyristoyl] glucosamine N-acyltransferase
MKFPQTFTLREVCSWVNCRYQGADDFPVSGINEIHMVEAGDITFVDHPKYYDKALKSKATIVIINKEVPCPEGKALIFSDDPFSVYNYLTKRFRPIEVLSKNVSDSAQIGEGTVIMPGAIIGNYVTLGKNCFIHPNVVIYDHCILGDNVIIHANTTIGGDAFYFKKRPTHYEKMHSCGRVVIQDDVEIGAGCTIDKGVSGDTVIGKGTKFDNLVHIGHDTVVGKNVLMAAQCVVAGVTVIEDDVILWGQVAVQKDLIIGKGAIVLGKSGVSKSLEGGKTYFGVFAREQRAALKELAYIRRLPELFNK